MNFLALLVMFIPAILLIVVFFFLRKTQVIPARVFLIFGITGILFILGLFFLESSDKLTDTHLNEISSIINGPLEMPKDEQQQQFQLMGLSHAAAGFAQYAEKYPESQVSCQRNISAIVNFTTDEKNFSFLKNRRLWRDHVFTLIHINSILNDHAKVNGTDSISQLHDRLNKFLAGSIVQSRYKNLQSFAGDQNYWTADNTVLIHGLKGTDHITGGNSAARPAKDWVSFISKEIFLEASKLPCSAFTDKDKCKEMPHATHLGIMTAALSDVAPETATGIWRQLRHHYKNGVLGIFATVDQFHPEETPPAYQNSIHHPLDAVRPELTTMYAAAKMNHRLTYFQITNQLWLNEVFGKSANKPKQDGYQWKHFLELSLRFNAETVF
jgi:hypothetical protein